MSGIFDRMNNSVLPPPVEGATLSPAFLCGVLVMKNQGLRTNQQLLENINAELDSNLDAEAIQDIQDMATYIAAGLGEVGQVARLDRICIVAGIWETGQAGITEAEARALTGVTFTYGI